MQRRQQARSKVDTEYQKLHKEIRNTYRQANVEGFKKSKQNSLRATEVSCDRLRPESTQCIQEKYIDLIHGNIFLNEWICERCFIVKINKI